MDSNLVCIRPPTWFERPFWPSKEVSKVMVCKGFLGVFSISLGACPNLGQGPKDEYRAHDDDTALGINSHYYKNLL